MASRHCLPLACALLLTLPLAGCADDDPPAAPGTGASATSTTEPPAPLPEPQVFAGVCQATGGLSYGYPGLGASGEPAVCPFAQAAPGDLSHIQGGVVEVTWTPGATTAGGHLLVQSDSCWQGMRLSGGAIEQGMCDQGNLQSASPPLRLELGASVFQRYGADNLTAMVLAHGATTGQAFIIYVTLFEAQPPVGFTAIPG